MSSERGRRWAWIVRPSAKREVDEELAFHFEERVREYRAQGLAEDAARAAARQRLGSLEDVQRECTALLSAERRVERRRDWLRISWLDVKLGTRMLLKYPGLSITGVLALAFAIWMGVGTFEFIKQFLLPSMPLPDGDRIVALELRNRMTNHFERRLLQDFQEWRAGLRTVSDLGAFRTVERNLITGPGAGEPVEIAEISAAAFRVAPVRPLLGRTLLPADEDAAAPAVAVIGHDVWHSRFGSDSTVIGRSISLGRTRTTIVGVMPEGYGFPISHSLWVPLKLDPLQHGRGEGPALHVFGKLVADASIADALSELNAMTQRVARESPDTHEHLYPVVLRHPRSVIRVYPNDAAAISSINLFVLMLVVLICGNIALLMFARAATRENELLVRSALGAGRGRLVVQLFTESLVLGVIGAALGLAAAGAGLRWLFHVVESGMMEGSGLPFWITAELSPVSYLYALALTLLTAVITGVLPGLKVTGKGVGSRLREASAGGGGFRFGGIWTWVIIGQIAVTVAFPAVSYVARNGMTRLRDVDISVPVEQYAAARLEMDRDPPPGVRADTTEAAFVARYERALRELERRIEAAPGVHGVTFGELLPLMEHPNLHVEVQGGGAALSEADMSEYGDPNEVGYLVTGASVALDYFDVMGKRMLQGRPFHSGDLADDATAVIVTESFVRRVLGDRNPIGRRIRYRLYEDLEPGAAEAEAQPWYEIIGVVPDLGTSIQNEMKHAAIFHPRTPGDTYPVSIAVHSSGDASALIPLLRATAAAVEPSLRVYNPGPLRSVLAVEMEFYEFFYRLSLMVSTIALTLSLASIYAVVSYTVARRTREIGIRVALGGTGRSIARAVLRRPLAQVLAGVLFGALILFGLMVVGYGASARGTIVLAGYGAMMFGVCLLACVTPTRRALAVQPVEAMRIEG